MIYPAVEPMQSRPGHHTSLVLAMHEAVQKDLYRKTIFGI
jgi:hypothetical protein